MHKVTLFLDEQLFSIKITASVKVALNEYQGTALLEGGEGILIFCQLNNFPL